MGGWGGGGWEARVELWPIGNNIMRLVSFLYIAASHTAHVQYFSCVYIL